MALRVRLQTVRLDDKSTATGSHAAGTEMERTHARTHARMPGRTHTTSCKGATLATPSYARTAATAAVLSMRSWCGPRNGGDDSELPLPCLP